MQTSVGLNETKTTVIPRLLFYGIGNVGRGDDGLGIRLIEALEQMALPENIGLEANYQLNIEDALEISNYDVVVFVDASKEPDAQTPYGLRRIFPADEIAFTTHAMSMAAVLGLTDHLYERQPKAFLLTLPGYDWEITDQLSAKATENLNGTLASLGNILSNDGGQSFIQSLK